jgi:hypothetical protein
VQEKRSTWGILVAGIVLAFTWFETQKKRADRQEHQILFFVNVRWVYGEGERGWIDGV